MKSKMTHFCFDLDGTLVESNQTIYKATEFALNHLGIEFNVNENEFAQKIGQHFNDIFDSFNINVTDFEEFIDIYKENYFDQMKYSKLYDFVEETLKELKNRNTKISLLTTKGQDQADKIINYFDLGTYFDLVMGRRDGIAHKPSAESLLIICNELNVDVTNTLIIGDTELDIQCGKNAGTKTCGVLYGYRTRKLLEIEQPNFIISSINEILNLENES
jgi:HAD superfamily hydrolase (TIGR01549 family)